MIRWMNLITSCRVVVGRPCSRGYLRRGRSATVSGVVPGRSGGLPYMTGTFSAIPRNCRMTFHPLVES
jgi:hypothetical protein